MLIIYAHPSKDGHCGEILRQVEDRLKSQKKDYEILDLYKLSFDPVLSSDEFARRDNSQGIVADLQAKIQKNNEIVFIYPNWWSMPPAILKGFFDRVLIAGFAFKYVNSRPVALLKNKKAILLNTTGGPYIYQLLIGKPSVRLVQKNILKFCGINAKSFLLASAIEFTDESKFRISKLVDKAFHYLS